MLFRVPIVFRREILIRRQNVRSLDPSPLRFLIPPSFAPVRNPVSSGNVRLPAGKRRPLALLPPPPRSAGCGHCLRATPRRKEPPSGAVERPPSFPAGKGGPIPFDRSRQRKEPIRTRPPERRTRPICPERIPAGGRTDRRQTAFARIRRTFDTGTSPRNEDPAGKTRKDKTQKKAVRFANGLMSLADRPYSEFT